jgi:Holliday junction DNA helicase RuvA
LKSYIAPVAVPWEISPEKMVEKARLLQLKSSCHSRFTIDDSPPYLRPMISFLKGQFVRKTPSFVHVDVNGVGYEVQISLNTYSKIQDQEEGLIHTHLIVREDAHLLFGFFDLSEKEMFLQLTAISGIGANTARVMLSYMKPDELSRAIIQGNVKMLEGIKGIGKKTAERIVVELRDKLAKQPIETAPNISSWKGNTLQSDALNALIALGINRQAADQAIQKVLEKDPEAGVELLIKKALQIL